MMSLFRNLLIRLKTILQSWLYAPVYTPDKNRLLVFNLASDTVYADWIHRNQYINLDIWMRHFVQAKKYPSAYKISIVTPVYNPALAHFQQCIESVQYQTSPHWEWIIADDHSSSADIIKLLHSNLDRDPRIKVLFSRSAENLQGGISATTNNAIAAASGDYIVFLDHDDRLNPMAIEAIHQSLAEQDYDIIYSDRDMLTPNGKRENHLMKPQWSPETLLSGNYIFHMMCYKKSLIKKIGLLDSRYDGSQDYDLILKASECNPKVRHIPRVLYHWQQHRKSISANDGAKEYTFQAGIQALSDSLKRRQLSAASVSENPHMWRGNYQIHFSEQPFKEHLDQILQIKIDCDDNSAYAQQINEVIADHHDSAHKYILIIDKNIDTPSHKALLQMLQWMMQFKHIAMLSPKIINKQQQLLYTGLIFNSDGRIIAPYQGYPLSEHGYMGVNSINRNISLINPFCVCIRVTIWRQYQGLNPSYQDSLSMLDLNLRLLKDQRRFLYLADCMLTHTCSEPGIIFYPQSGSMFEQWQTLFKNGDYHYNPNLCQHCDDMGLSFDNVN
jgi:glycosyltransferase involved in cell wall biosynthesis